MNTYVMPNGDIELGDFPYRRSSDWANVVWIITEQCNLGCPYCIGFKSKGKATSLIDTLGVDGVVSRFENLRQRSGKNLYVTLTGGEPTIVDKLPELCHKLINKKFIIELQSNMTTGVDLKKFVDAVDPAGVAQIMATYHGWALDNKLPKLHENYINNFKYATAKGIMCVLKTVVPPGEITDVQAKLQKLKKELPVGAVVMPWLFIKGLPKSKNNMGNAYPYGYTREQHALLDTVCTVRGECQRLYRGGAGFFTGMPCDAGSGFLIIKCNGDAGRCYTLKTDKDCLGNLADDNINLHSAPKPCTAPFCGTSFWGMWFGTAPWNYVPNSDKNNAYYCKFGPDWK